MRLIIAGDRKFSEYHIFEWWVTDVNKMWAFSEIVSGGAKGADQMGEVWAEQNHVPCKVFPADWAKHGKAAGAIRNAEMGDYSNALLAFVSPRSKGTVNMIDYMRSIGKPAIVVPIP